MSSLKEHHEVVIVGGGIAGLAAAWSLRDRDVCVLEAEPCVGGRLRSEARDPYWLNLGAHILKAGGPMATLAEEVGVPLVVPPGAFLAVAMGGRIVCGSRAEAMLFRLPLSLSARASLARVGWVLLQARRESATARDRLEGMTLAGLLGPMHPDVHALMRVIANRIGGELEEISAAVGVSAFFQLWLGMRVNVAGGSAQLPAALHAALGARVQTGARVTGIAQSPRAVKIEYTLAMEQRRISASACIVAVPAPLARSLIHDLPPDRDAALRRVQYTPFVVAGLFTDETNAMPWDDLYALAVPGRSFCMFFNPANALRQEGKRQPGGSLVLYSVADRAAELLERSDAAIHDLYLADLYDIFPQARGIVREVVIQRWPLGTFVAFPGRAAVRERLAEPCGRIFFAGDYMLAADGVDASHTGREAAAAVNVFLQRQGVMIHD